MENTTAVDESTLVPMGREKEEDNHTVEDYLEAIVVLRDMKGSDEIRSVDLANMRNVSKASVNKALSIMREKGYVEQERYGRITLTEAGLEYGTAVWRRHQVLRGFLVDELGVDPEEANREACRMEHAISEDTMARWEKYLEARRAERAEAAAE